MCHGKLGSSHSVLDPTKRPAPVWRETYKKPDGAKRARWSAVGKLGNQPACRSRHGRCRRFEVITCTRSQTCLSLFTLLLTPGQGVGKSANQRETAIFLLSKRSIILASGTSIT